VSDCSILIGQGSLLTIRQSMENGAQMVLSEASVRSREPCIGAKCGEGLEQRDKPSGFGKKSRGGDTGELKREDRDETIPANSLSRGTQKRSVSIGGKTRSDLHSMRLLGAGESLLTQKREEKYLFGSNNHWRNCSPKKKLKFRNSLSGGEGLLSRWVGEPVRRSENFLTLDIHNPKVRREEDCRSQSRISRFTAFKKL